MQSLQPTPVRHAFPQLRRLHFFSPHNQRLIADYLTHLRVRHYAPSTQEGTLRALKCFAVLMPEARQAILYQDLAQTTPADIDAWIEAAFQQSLAPATIATCRRGMQSFFIFLRDQGVLAQSPIQLPRHQVLVPMRLPRPMAEAEVVAFFRVIDTLQDRTMFLFMLRCGLRVSEVSGLPWSAIDLGQGTLRVDNRKGQVDRVVSLSPDVATALRQWQPLQAAAVRYVFPSRMARKGGLPLGARQIRNRMTRSLKLAGIPKRYSPHSLRHTFATQLLNAGASLEVVKELMGHRSLQMTLRSTQLYDRTKRTQYDQAMAQVEQRQGLRRREPMDDIRQTTIDRFRAYLERRQFSAHTVVSYTLDLRLFFADVTVPLAQVSFREVDQFVERQHQHGRAWATINRRLNALKHFFDFCLDQQWVAGNPVKPSHFVRRGHPLPKALAGEQVQRLFAQMVHPMDHALFLVMLRCGLRVSEVAQLKLAQIDWEQPALHMVQGKGRKDRRVYMSPDLVASLHDCLAQHPGDPAQGYVFWNRKHPQQPLSVKAIQKQIERYAKTAGVTASCHSLRHTFASNLLEHGAEVVTIRDFLGHSQIASSERDAKVSSQKVKQEYMRTMQKILKQGQVEGPRSRWLKKYILHYIFL